MPPTYILGVNAFHPDASAVLLRDAEIVGALAEERLNRIRHYGGFPRLAVKKLLEMAGIGVRDLDHIAIGADARANFTKKIAFGVSNVERVGRIARQRLESLSQSRDVAALVAEAGGVAPAELHARVHHIEHHLAHGASAFYLSGHERAAVLSLDGFGDFASTMTALGEGRQLRVFDRVFFPHSLGIFYTAIAQLLGFNEYGEEASVMELAATGEPRHLDLMKELIQESDGGLFQLELSYFLHPDEGVEYRFHSGKPVRSPLYSEALTDKLGGPRTPGTPYTDRDRDLACSLQTRLEQIYFHILHDLYRRTGAETVCVAGVVALNAVANGKILTSTPFKQLCFQPAAADDGTALGAALFVHHAVLQGARSSPLRHAFWGTEYDDAELARAVQRSGLLASKLDDDLLYERTVRRLAAGKKVGWFQGRMEWGTRPLGARSLLARLDAARGEANDRAGFWSCSILEERAEEVFPAGCASPFMLAAYPLKSGKGVARVQTVSARDCPRFHRLLHVFAEFTGQPVLSNTSFNENEPIVCTPEDALACYAETSMDALVIGNWFLEKV